LCKLSAVRKPISKRVENTCEFRVFIVMCDYTQQNFGSLKRPRRSTFDNMGWQSDRTLGGSRDRDILVAEWSHDIAGDGIALCGLNSARMDSVIWIVKKKKKNEMKWNLKWRSKVALDLCKILQ
jgi:hypothetical protein